MVLQQEALFEMHSPGGSLDKAANLLQEAYNQAPYNRAIAHSLSELALKRAEVAKTDVEKNKHIKESKSIASKLISAGSISPYPHHTLIKTDLKELEDLVSTSDEASLERQIKSLEKKISQAIQLFPDDAYIRELESRFGELIDNHEKARSALENAYNKNKRSTYIASRLAKLFEADGNLEGAIKVLKECLDLNPSDKVINFQLAMLLRKDQSSKAADILHHLRRSFTKGDSNFVAQFWYARYLYVDGEMDRANAIFRVLSDSNIDTRVKNEPRGEVVIKGEPKRYSGTVLKKEANYAFLVRDISQDTVFAHKKYQDEKEWEKLRYSKRVTFNLAFNYRGPSALNITEE